MISTFEQAGRKLLSRVPFPGLLRSQGEEYPLTDLMHDHIAFASSDPQKFSPEIETVRARQMAARLECVAEDVGAQAIALQAFVPESTINGIPGPVGDTAKQLSEQLNALHTEKEVTLIEEPAALKIPIGHTSVSGAETTLEHALEDAAEKKPIAITNASTLFVAVIRPEVGHNAFKHIDRSQLVGGGILKMVRRGVLIPQ